MKWFDPWCQDRSREGKEVEIVSRTEHSSLDAGRISSFWTRHFTQQQSWRTLLVSYQDYFCVCRPSCNNPAIFIDSNAPVQVGLQDRGMLISVKSPVSQQLYNSCRHLCQQQHFSSWLPAHVQTISVGFDASLLPVESHLFFFLPSAFRCSKPLEYWANTSRMCQHQQNHFYAHVLPFLSCSEARNFVHCLSFMVAHCLSRQFDCQYQYHLQVVLGLLVWKGHSLQLSQLSLSIHYSKGLDS